MPDVWEDVYGLVQRGDESSLDEAIDAIFNYVDDLLLGGDFDVIDKELDRVDLARLDSVTIVGILSITYAGRSELKRRENFRERARLRLLELKPPGYVERLIRER